MGGSFGVAIFGAIFAARLADQLVASAERASSTALGSGVQLSPAEAAQAAAGDARRVPHGIRARAARRVPLGHGDRDHPVRALVVPQGGAAAHDARPLRRARERAGSRRAARRPRSSSSRSSERYPPSRGIANDHVRMNVSSPPLEHAQRRGDEEAARRRRSSRCASRSGRPSRRRSRLSAGRVRADDARRERLVLVDLVDRIGLERDLRARSSRRGSCRRDPSRSAARVRPVPSCARDRAGAVPGRELGHRILRRLLRRAQRGRGRRGRGVVQRQQRSSSRRRRRRA